MVPQLNSSTTATIAITLIVLVGMYILYKDLKKLEVSIEKLQTRAACAKVLSKPPRNEIVEDVLGEEDLSKEDQIEAHEATFGAHEATSGAHEATSGAHEATSGRTSPLVHQQAMAPPVDVVGAAIQKLKDEVLEEEEAAAAETVA